PEARPAGPRVVLGVRIEQRGPAAHAAVDARLLRIPVLARERPFSAALTGHVVLFGRQAPAPLLVGQDDPVPPVVGQARQPPLRPAASDGGGKPAGTSPASG